MTAFRGVYPITFVLLLVVVTIIGTLMGLAAMAVVQAREAANRSACKNNMKQLAHAFQNHQNLRGDNVPLALFSKGHSWPVLSGLYVDGYGYWAPSDHKEPYNSPKNERLQEFMATIPFYYCPGRRTAQRQEYAAGDYAVPSLGVVGSNDPRLNDTWMQAHDPEKNLGPFLLVWRTRPEVFSYDPLRYRSQTSLASWLDGSSNQIVLGEKALHPSNLNKNGKGGDFTISSWIENDYNASGCSRNGALGVARSPWDEPDRLWPRFGSWHRDVCLFAYGDGRVQEVSNFTSPSVLREECHRGSGEPQDQNQSTAANR